LDSTTDAGVYVTIFDAFFERATGVRPYGYQRRLAEKGLPPVLTAPTGTGKTAAVILAWLWRRLHLPDAERRKVPRRLIFALPQRTLVEQTAREVARWLDNLRDTDVDHARLIEDVTLHVVMGGEGKTQGEWRIRMDKPAIVVGTVDSLVSKALNRGYGISRALYPVDFALVTNGAQWVIDEIQLCPESTTTLRQLAAFLKARPDRPLWTAEPFALTCMSATVPSVLLDTVDNPRPAEHEIVSIEPEDRVGELARRLGATRTVRRLPVAASEPKPLAEAVRQRHRPGTLTLVVVNTVRTARALYQELRKAGPPCTLLHSRFRGVDRDRLMDQVLAQPGPEGHIVVSTQVVEAGVDIDAAVLVTEAAPWPSVVQRAGRCNRTGTVADVELWWCPPAKPEPYDQDDVAASVAELDRLEGQAVTGEDLQARDVAVKDPAVSVLRWPDLVALFDTAQDLNGGDVDVSPYVRDAEDLDVQLAWARWDPVDDHGRPPDRAKPPEARYRCRVPLRDVRDLARSKAIWRFEQGEGVWSRVSDAAPPRPGEVLVMAAADGTYDPDMGFDPSVRAAVPDTPELPLRPDRTIGADPTTGTEDAYRQDEASVAQREWISLQQHSDDTRVEAAALLAALQVDLPAALAEAVVTAAYVHDVGKSHPMWQDALCRLATEDERARIEAGRPWAKSASPEDLRFEGGVKFRHELASLLLLDGPLRPLLDGVEEPDLVRYLVLAHHGKLRVEVRGIDDVDEEVLLGLKRGAEVPVPPLLGQPAGTLVIDLEQFTPGSDRSWTRTVLRLRDRFGPFVLAYLETLVRMADWRASEAPGASLTAPKEAQ
jgi:CRISPR-associated endonuclease/helicase Cas3